MRVGYNWSGFYDSDFRDSEYTQEGIWFGISYKFDEQTASRVAGLFNGRPTLELPTEQPEVPVAEPEQPNERPSVPAISLPIPDEAPAVPSIVYSTAPISPSGETNTCAPGIMVRVIQLAAFSELGVARGMLEFFGFENGFIEAYQPADSSQPVYRVIVGPYTESKEELAEAAAIFEAETGWEPWIKDKDCSDLRRVD